MTDTLVEARSMAGGEQSETGAARKRDPRHPCLAALETAVRVRGRELSPERGSYGRRDHADVLALDRHMIEVEFTHGAAPAHEHVGKMKRASGCAQPRFGLHVQMQVRHFLVAVHAGVGDDAIAGFRDAGHLGDLAGVRRADYDTQR